MTSILHLGIYQENLTACLAALLEQAERIGDFFTPTTIVVPNRYLAKWLRLELARRRGIAINLRVEYLLEAVLWQLLEECHGRPNRPPLEQLTDAHYRLMILAALMDTESADTALGPLRSYLGGKAAATPGRDSWRRAWQLADRLAGLLRDYEYHRHEQLIRPWLAGTDAYPDAAPAALQLERSQRELYRRILDGRTGLREVLGRHEGKCYRSLAQYAAEVMALSAEKLKPPASRPIHLFGLTQISGLHVRILRWLASRHELHLYHLNPLVGQLPQDLAGSDGAGALRALAGRLRHSPAQPQQEHELLHCWGRAAAESLWLMADLVAPNAFHIEMPSAGRSSPSACLLHRLHEALTGAVGLGWATPADRSVQVVACPGLERSVETVYQSILYNLRQDPTLRLTDIVVLVTDMPRYRPVLQTVFDREFQAGGERRRLPFNLADYSAAELSPFGHAALGLLDLALDSFWRSHVFAVVLNPCFLARLGVDREQALVWLAWAEQLGIYHAWDRQDKRERGYSDSPLYCWQLGLRRLRLGRLMDVADERFDLPAPRFGEVVPFADLASGDKELLDGFGRAVEQLLPRLAKLRRQLHGGREWAWQLRQLFDDFLAVPSDRPKEEEVRGTLYQALERLQLLDTLRPGHKGGLPLALVREFVQDNLEGCVAKAGEFLTGGVTLSAMQPLLPVPFRLVYLLGLEEGLFPGSSAMPALDLRSRERCPGDICPAESNQGLFVQAILAAQEKLYLVYNNRDLQRDQVLNPCSPLNQLQRFLDSNLVLGGRLPIAQAPLSSSDPSLLGPPSSDNDVCVGARDAEQLLAAFEGEKRHILNLTEEQQAELKRRWRTARRAFATPPAAITTVRKTPIITLAELRTFLRCPAEAALRRHLRVRDDEESEATNEEPFYTTAPFNFRFVQTALEHFLGRALTQTVDETLRQWRPRLRELHEDWRRRGRVPEDAFGQVDIARFEDYLAPRLEGSQGLARFLRERPPESFRGPVLLGTSLTPVGARQRFPALRLSLTETSIPEVDLVGNWPYLWRQDDSLDMLVLSRRTRRKPDSKHLSVALFEPLLLLLTLRAEPQPRPGAQSAEDWLGERAWNIHVLDDEGILHFTWQSTDVSANAARAYLEQLATDFLDRNHFDLLPFDLLDEAFLRGAYTGFEEKASLHWFEDAPASFRRRLEHEPCGMLSADNDEDKTYLEEVRRWYREAFQDEAETDSDRPHPKYRPMAAAALIQSQVPVDALDKIRRRFWLLDRGPARARGVSCDAD